MATKHEKVLVAAFQEWPEASFSAEDLVVACWTRYPEDFGLQGYQKMHPDANVVYRYIMGQNSIVKKHKWMLLTDTKMYRLSNKGVQRALEMMELSIAPGKNRQEQRIRIDRARELILSRLLRSRAWDKHQANEEIVYREACVFMGISPRSTNEEFHLARNETDEALRLAKDRFSESSSASIAIVDGNFNLSVGDLEELEALDRALLDQFRDEFETIARRVVDYGKVRYTPRR